MTATSDRATKLVIATGTNRGFGLAVVKAFAESEGSNLFLYGLANRCSVETTKLAVSDAIAPERLFALQLNFDECSSPAEYCSTFRTFLDSLLTAHESITDVLLLSNAGSLGPLVSGAELCDFAAEVSQAVTTNVTLPMLLISTLLKVLKARDKQIARADIVNVSSLCAVSPFEYWSVYCAGKAHRDMLLQCFAHEAATLGSEHISLRFLNYAPGPLNTDMQKQIRDELPGEAAIRQAFVGMHEEGKLVDPKNSAKKLLTILAGTFASGAHIDYYDPT